MTARRLVALLGRLGCEKIRQRGSHQTWRCGNCRTVIPMHTGDLTIGTLHSIERDLEACLGPKWLTRGRTR